MSSTFNTGAPVLTPPERNNFFYGMLLDVEACQKDQRHADLKRSLLNRFILGRGVACGLRLSTAMGPGGGFRLDPGVAIDGWGREIVVSEASSFDPHQLTDDEGAPVGDPLASGTVAVFLAYGEAQTDPVPALAAGYDSPEPCAPSTVREGYRIVVRTAVPPTPATSPDPGPWTDPAALHAWLSDRVGALSSPAMDPAVPLGQVTLDTGTVDDATVRPLILSQALLWELITSLAAEVAALKASP